MHKGLKFIIATRTRRILALVGLLGLGAIALHTARGTAADKSAAAGGPGDAPPAEVEVAVASLKTLPRITEFVGRIESCNPVQVRARVSGFLEKQLFADGAMVKKDQPLFAIESKNYLIMVHQAQAELAKAKATLTNARKGVTVLKARGELMSAQATRIRAQKDLARIKPLAAADATSKQDLDAAEASQKEAQAMEEALQAAYDQAKLNQATDIELAEAAVKSAEAAVEMAKLNLGYTDVRSPIDGRIGRAEVLPGALVGKDDSTLLATLAPVDPMWATWSISEQEYLSLVNDKTQPSHDLSDRIQKIEMVLADGSVYPQPGHINFVDRAIDAKTNTLGMRGEFANPTGLLREGQFCRIRITRQSDTPSLMVPQLAAQELQGQTFVYVVAPDGSVAQRKIQPGDRVGSELAVKEGLKAGERVAIGGIQKIHPGAKVKALEAQPTPAPQGK
jgi:membrane fusion protein (multidrug efflux system)